jgi:hypothetical protein
MMTPERFLVVEKLYHAALELPSDQRADFLAQACGDDESLQRKVVSLLKAHERAGDFLVPPLRSTPLARDAAPILKPGTQFGPYKLIVSVGRGGMGEVYRAKDTRLGREVAIKVLPSEFSSDSERLKYFEQEARSASALNHPNIVTIYDIGRSDFGSFIAMELVDGLTLRTLLAHGPLPQKKLLNVAAQVADGLANAHAAGIVHRDLKPENLMITKEGLVKILDFGVAKLLQPIFETAEPEPGGVTTTEIDTFLGTAGYMSPEQASGRPVDFRSDQFSFGAVFYEMATGKRAFCRDSESETLSAIVRDEPAPVARLNSQIPPPARWIIERCLAKDPRDRYASTLDLARELQNLRDHSAELAAVETASVPGVVPGAGFRRPRGLAWFAISMGLLAVLVGAFFLARNVQETTSSFRQLTFAQSNVTGARFAADGQSVIYGTNSAGRTPELFTTRPGNPESRSLRLPGSGIWSISPSGEMALAVGCTLNWGDCMGTLALAPPSGGAPREIVANVHTADWAPDGKALAIAQYMGGKDQIQYPIGHVLYETTGWVGDVRVSPRGDLIAFLDYPILGSKAGSVCVLDSAGNKKTLSAGWTGLHGLAWSAHNSEIWFSGSKLRAGPDRIHAVSLSGHEREILSSLSNVQILDISRNSGQVLLRQGTARAVMVGLAPREVNERDLSWFDFSTVADFSADGTTVLFYEWGVGVEGKPTVFLRRTDGSDAIRLGEGKPLALSPDKRWALALRETPPAQLVLLPTGAGEQKLLPRGPVSEFLHWAAFSPDSERIFFSAEESGHRRRTYAQGIDGGLPQPLTPPGFVGSSLSSDGSRLTVVGRHGGYYIYKIGEEPEPLEGYEDGDEVLGWGADGRSLFLRAAGDMKLNIFKLDLGNDHREFWKELAPPHASGLIGIATDPGQIRLTADGRSYAYTYWTFPSDLYLVEGLR